MSDTRKVTAAVRSIGDGSTAIAAFKAILNSVEFSDVTFTFDNTSKSFHAHRCILAARSEVFKNMLFGCLKEGTDKIVKLPDVDADAFYIVLEWAYTGMVEMTPDEVLGVLQLAKLYCFDDLEQLCRGLATNFIDEPNVLTLLNAAIRISEETVISDCLHFLEQHCGSIIQQAAWLNLYEEGLMKILLLTTLDCSEQQLFQRTLEWVNNCTDDRHAMLRKVLPMIRLPQIPVNILYDEVRVLCREVPELQQLYIEALEFKAIPQRLAGCPSVLPRRPSCLGKIITQMPASFLDGWRLVLYDLRSNFMDFKTKIDISACEYIAFGEFSGPNIIETLAVGHVRRALCSTPDTKEEEFYWHHVANFSFGVSSDSNTVSGYGALPRNFFGCSTYEVNTKRDSSVHVCPETKAKSADQADQKNSESATGNDSPHSQQTIEKKQPEAVAVPLLECGALSQTILLDLRLRQAREGVANGVVASVNRWISNIVELSENDTKEAYDPYYRHKLSMQSVVMRNQAR